MFEDRTAENIMDEMLAGFGAGVRTDEGSLAYNACAKIAEKLEEIYADMEDIFDNMNIDTMDLAHLIPYAQERGLSFRYATYPVVKGVFSQEMEIGSRLSCQDYIYEVTDKIEGFAYRLQCETEGAEANGTLGELAPVDYIDNYEGGQITEIISAGEDDEDTEAFRERVIQSFQSLAFGGNKADYRRFINAMEGVGGCKPKRRSSDSPWIYCTIISNDYGKPSEELVKTVQSLVDPETNHGEGDGAAPVCHNVLISGVEEAKVDVETCITWDDGYGTEGSMSQINEALDTYLLKLRMEWENNEFNDTIVRISQIDARIMGIEGVLDVTGTKINMAPGNFMVPYHAVPVKGDVNVI